MYKNKKKEAIFLDIYLDEKENKETFQPYRYEIIDVKDKDGNNKKDLKWIPNKFVRTKAMNRKARLIANKNNRK